MRSLKTITSEMKDVSRQKSSLEDALHKSKRKITDPYVVRQLIYGVMIFVLPLSLWMLWMEWNEGVIFYPSWQSEITHYPWFLKIVSFVITPIAYVGTISLFVFSFITLICFKKKFMPYELLSYIFFSKATHQRMRRIEVNDFSQEPELARLSSELEEKKQAYEVIKAEYEHAEQDFQNRVQSFINSCEDEEVREYLIEKTQKEDE